MSRRELFLVRLFPYSEYTQQNNGPRNDPDIRQPNLQRQIAFPVREKDADKNGVFFVFYDFKKLIHLGASKKDFYFGALVSYVGLAFLVSLLNTGIHLLIDPLNHTQTVINLMAVCGWMENNVFFAFVQQAVFLLLSMVFLHVLLSMQPHWYGWLTDIILVAIICIFTPIAPLRGLLAGFFKVIMFNPNALAHISICIGVSAALSAVGLTVLKQKTL